MTSPHSSHASLIFISALFLSLCLHNIYHLCNLWSKTQSLREREFPCLRIGILAKEGVIRWRAKFGSIHSLHHANLVEFHIRNLCYPIIFIEQFHLAISSQLCGSYEIHHIYISEHTQSYNVIDSLHHANLIKFTSQFLRIYKMSLEPCRPQNLHSLHQHYPP